MFSVEWMAGAPRIKNKNGHSHESYVFLMAHGFDDSACNLLKFYANIHSILYFFSFFVNGTSYSDSGKM